MEAGMASSVYPLPGDIEEIDPGEARFDLVLCGSILCHFSGERLRSLLSRLFRCLAQGGVLAIEEPLADEGRCESEAALMAAFQLLLFVPGGRVRTFHEYLGVLEGVGFRQVELEGGSVILARKGGMFGGRDARSRAATRSSGDSD